MSSRRQLRPSWVHRFQQDPLRLYHGNADLGSTEQVIEERKRKAEERRKERQQLQSKGGKEQQSE